DLGSPGLAADRGRPSRRHGRQGGRKRDVSRRRSVRQAARFGTGHLRAHSGPLHPVRASRHLRSLAEDPALLLDLPALQARHLPAPEGVHAVGASAMTFFAADGLVMDFGGIRAVEGVSFTVEPRHVFTIIGPNGAGKTTIFNLVSRIYDPT